MKKLVGGYAAFLVITALIVIGGGGVLEAKVSIRQGLSVDGSMILVTDQREVYTFEGPGQPLSRIGRLPKGLLPLVAGGTEAWTVNHGRHRLRSIRLVRIDPFWGAIEQHTPTSAGDNARVTIEGIAGFDSQFVYLSPGLRYRRADQTIEARHLDRFPELEVLETRSSGVETWYLAQEVAPGESPTLSLLYSRVGSEQWLRVDAGPADGNVQLYADRNNLFLVHSAGRALRFDKHSLRLVEDLTPMLRKGSLDYFAVDESHYWVQSAGSLQRIDRKVLDGVSFQAPAVAAGSITLADDGQRIWLAASGGGSVVSLDKSNGTVQPYEVMGRHARRARAFGRGTARVMLITVAVPLVVITAPIWITIMLVDGCC